MVIQILLLREFLSQFKGNEFTISLILFSWLLLGGIGTWLARLLQNSLSVSVLVRSSFVLAALYPATILSIRFTRAHLFIPGIDVGFYPTLACIVVLSLGCGLLVGFVLPCSLHVIRESVREYAGARIYILDNIGDVSGGALFSFVLVFYATPLSAAFLAGFFLLVTAWYALDPDQRIRPVNLGSAGLVFCILLGCSMAETPSLTPFEGELVSYQESRYGRVTVNREGEQSTLFLNGSPLYSTQNSYQAEKTVHYPLSQLSRPRTVLLIGAESGQLRELGQYHLERIDYLELDEKVIETQFDHGFLEEIPGLNIIFEDGRRFLAKTPLSYDAIILNLPDPDTFQVNRYYTTEFFELVRDHLTPQGIFSFSVGGYDNYLARPQQLKISSLYQTGIRSFPNILLIPGGAVFFLCSQVELDSDIPLLLEEKQISTRFISGFYRGNVTPMRIRYLQDHILSETPLNSDFKPFLIRVMFDQWFARFNTSPYPFWVVVGLLATVYLIRCRKEELVLFSTGFVTMGSEALVILVYQILFGYVYLQVGLLVTTFLLGLFPGAILGEIMRKKGRLLARLMLVDTCILLLLGTGLLALLNVSDSSTSFSLYLFGFSLSFFCGCQFPLALSLGGEDGSAAVRTFSADLIGASLGILVTSLLLVPFLGVYQAILGLLIVKGAGTVVLLFSRTNLHQQVNT